MTKKGIVKDILTKKDVDKDYESRPYFLLEWVDGTYRVAYQNVCPSFCMVLNASVRELNQELLQELMAGPDPDKS